MGLRSLSSTHICTVAKWVSGKLRNTRINVRISIQLHVDYREYRPCATDPVSAYFQYHFTLFLTAPLAGREAGVEGFDFGAVLTLDTEAFAALVALAVGGAVIRLGCGALGLLIGLGAVRG